MREDERSGAAANSARAHECTLFEQIGSAKSVTVCVHHPNGI